MDSRYTTMNTWLGQMLAKLDLNNYEQFEISPVAGDASFRRYFRVRGTAFNYIVMDAPPEKENSLPFVDIAQFWKSHGIQVPTIIAQDLEQGFLLLEDFGDTQLFTGVTSTINNESCNAPEASADVIYRAAITALHPIQQLPLDYANTLPKYDETLLRREMALFTDWLAGQALQLQFDEAEQSVIDRALDTLVKQALNQPQVVVHRDYHSRNLMLIEDQKIGIIDFQDAVFGPASYDLVSLLRDCYIEWPQSFIDRHCQEFLNATSVPELKTMPLAGFARSFDLMGMQRHLKASGIFVRLELRDQKAGYLEEVPRTLGYLVKVAKKYDDLKSFGELVSNRVLPAFHEFLCEYKTQS